MEERTEMRPSGRPASLSAKGLTGLRVFQNAKDAPLGRVRRLVFHPTERRCVGFLVKRPDAALMFRRKDVFVSIDGFSLEGDAVLIKDGGAFTGTAACKRMGVDLDRCIIWQGMPVVSEGGEQVGFVDDVVFSSMDGAVESIASQKGVTAKVLIGEVSIPRESIVGFRIGMGDPLNAFAEDEGQDRLCGAIVVSDGALGLDVEGGLADKAGRSVAIAAEGARRVKDAAKPKVSAAGGAAGRAIDKGAFATGRQLSRAKGMFAAFKSEYDKAVADDPERKKR